MTEDPLAALRALARDAKEEDFLYSFVQSQVDSTINFVEDSSTPNLRMVILLSFSILGSTILTAMLRQDLTSPDIRRSVELLLSELLTAYLEALSSGDMFK